MMKSLLLAFFVGLALASYSEDKAGLSSFQPKYCYKYRYEAQLVTGSSPSSKLWSGLRLTSDLDICFITDIKVTAKLSSVSLQKLNKFVEDRTPTFFMQTPETVMDGVEAEVTEVMVSQLKVPFYFVWKKGFITDIKFTAGEPLWSANIKRGVIGLFQVNLDEKYSVEPVLNKGVDYNPLRPSYTVWEPTPFGYCQTSYTPKPSEAVGSFYLTKVRDYTTCIKANPLSYVFNNFFSTDISNNTADHLNYKGDVTYAIKGDVKSFVIMTAIGESIVNFVPYAQQDGSVQTNINQTMYLLNTYPFEGSNPLGFDLTQRAPSVPLEVIPPARYFQDNEPYQQDQITPSSPMPLWDISKMDQLLIWAANGTQMTPTEEVTMALDVLTEMIRQSPFDVLDKLLQKAVNDKTFPDPSFFGQTKFEIYWDLLCSAGTTPAVTTVLNACLNNNTYGGLYNKCYKAVSAVGSYAPPTEQTFTQILMMLKKNQRDKPLRNVIALALGSLMGRAEDIFQDIQIVGKNHLESIDKIFEVSSAADQLNELRRTKKRLMDRLQDIANKHHKIEGKFDSILKDQFLKTNKDFELILALKVYRNAHVPITIPTVISYLVNPLLPTVVRFSAAQALEKFGRLEYSAKFEIVKVMEQVLKNPAEPTAIRIQCFRTLINIRAPVGVLYRLAASIRYEKQKQMATYVWSVFDKLRNCTFRPYMDAAEKLKSVISFLEPVEAGLQDTWYHQHEMPMANKLSMLGEASYINTPDGNYTTVAEFSHIFDIFGAANKHFTISWESTGFQKVLKRLMGPEGFFTKRNSLFDLLQRPRRATDTKDIIKNIFQALGINSALRDIPDPKGFLHVQMFNNIIRSYDLSNILKDIVDLNKIVTSFDENEMRAGWNLDYKMSGKMHQFFMDLPTEAGFPINLHMGSTYSLKVKGNLNAAVETSLFKDVRGDSPPAMAKGQVFLDPQFVAKFSGKMSVDAYLIQTGTVFHATAEYSSPLSVNATFWPLKSRFALEVSPPVDASKPVFKMSMKPYVYCLSMSNNVSKPQQQVNTRPYFVSMQPLGVSNGARIKDFKYNFGKDFLGYDISWQGEYQWRSLPSTPAGPMLGRSNYALYIRPGQQMPGKISLDFRYLAKPRYTDPESPKKGACDSWWSLIGFKCYGTDEEEDVTNVKNVKPTYPVPYSSFPDLGSKDITFSAVKSKMEHRVGRDIPELPSNSQWAFFAVLNASHPSLDRAYSVELLTQAWKVGKFHDSVLSVHRTPVPNYDQKPWKLLVQTYTTFPEKTWKIKDLLDTNYIAQTYTDIFDLIKTKEHQVVNRYFQSIVYTRLSHLAMWKLPSMDPQLLLDKVLPENALRCQNSGCSQVRQILKQLLPLHDQIRDLRSEMKDAFKIAARKGLLFELARQLSSIQNKTVTLLTLTPRDLPHLDTQVTSLVQYAVQKTSECLFNLREILNTGFSLGMLPINSTPLDVQQMNIFDLCKSFLTFNGLVELPDKYPKQSDGEYDPSTVSRIHRYNGGYSGYGYYNNYEAQPDTTLPPAPQDTLQEPGLDLETIVNYLKTLSNHQLKVISNVWRSIVRLQPINVQDINVLIAQTTSNITHLNGVLTLTPHSNDPHLMHLVYQTAVQQQILVDMTREEIYQNNMNTSDSQVSPSCRYALKVQTKEMTERASLIHSEIKYNKTCLVQLKGEEHQHLMSLYQLDRLLVATQHNHIRLPDEKTPWTATAQEVSSLASIKVPPMLLTLKSIRDKVKMGATMPHPCLAIKLVETTIRLQQQVSIFKRTLPAQYKYDEKLLSSMKQVDEQSMDLMVSYSDMFDQYIHGNSNVKPFFFDETSNPITQGWMEVKSIKYGQDQVLDKLRTYLQGSTTPPIDSVLHILQKAYDTSVDLKDKLKTAADAVKGSKTHSNPVSFISIYTLFYDALENQFDIYKTLEQQLRTYDKHPGLPDIQDSIEKDKVEIAKLAKDSSSWTQPFLQGAGVLPQPQPFNDVEDMYGLPAVQTQPDDSRAFAYGWGQPYHAKDIASKLQQPKISRTSVRDYSDILQPKINLPSTECNKGVCFVANITYGTVDMGCQKITVKIMGRKSVEQMLWETEQHFHESREICMTKAIQQTMSDRSTLEKCARQMQEKLNTYHHVHVLVQGEQLQLQTSVPNMLGYNVMDWVNSGMRWMESKHYDRSVVSPSLLTEDNTIQAVLEFSPTMTSVDHYYLTHEKTLALESVPLYGWIRTFYPFQNVDTLTNVAIKKMSARRMPSMCKLEGSNIKTADGGIVSLPWDLRAVGTQGCRVLLASDCSSDASFLINLLPNVTLPAHGIEILAEQHSIVLLPYYMSDTVMIDSQKVDLKYGTPIVFFKKIAYGKQAVSVVVSRSEVGIVRVEYPMVGLDINMDFKNINIGMSGIYKKQLCGLCGNFDGQLAQELQGPDGRSYTAAEDFFKSYLIPDKQCTLFPQSGDPSQPAISPISKPDESDNGPVFF